MTDTRQHHIEGTVFNIQRFSLHDGPGIRTTAFLKGCPMHCRWCHNPEAVLEIPELLYSADKCTGCGACIPICPEEAVTECQGKVAISEACTHCGQCVAVCPEQALDMSGRTMTAEAVTAELERDRVFYEESSGGITLSGGEPLVQPEFSLEILRLCKVAGLHTALDTCGFVETEALLAAIPFTDLFLYDFKHPDSTVHEEFTGRPNELIIENLKILCTKGCEVLVRQPIVPGFNDDLETVEQTGNILETCGVKRLQLLPYHALGRSKQEKLIHDAPVRKFTPPSNEQMLAIHSFLGRFPFETILGE